MKTALIILIGLAGAAQADTVAPKTYIEFAAFWEANAHYEGNFINDTRTTGAVAQYRERIPRFIAAAEQLGLRNARDLFIAQVPLSNEMYRYLYEEVSFSEQHPTRGWHDNMHNTCFALNDALLAETN